MDYKLKESGQQVQDLLGKIASLPNSEQLEFKVSNMQAVTYAELKALRDDGELVPGRLYRITDYVTTLPENVNDFTGEVMERDSVYTVSPASSKIS